ncbi:hypothetical protein IFM89_001899 [Coptis chinensis]|uniref:Uncharacterized protein n=1 Tax=Coptis chinensis TaxID=261450 RepID=A0A835IL11_9MAGN|nr:hypothetical protein IFM89_001899 [Coptis chinensis]
MLGSRWYAKRTNCSTPAPFVTLTPVGMIAVGANLARMRNPSLVVELIFFFLCYVCVLPGAKRKALCFQEGSAAEMWRLSCIGYGILQNGAKRTLICTKQVWGTIIQGRRSRGNCGWVATDMTIILGDEDEIEEMSNNGFLVLMAFLKGVFMSPALVEPFVLTVMRDKGQGDRLPEKRLGTPWTTIATFCKYACLQKF